MSITLKQIKEMQAEFDNTLNSSFSFNENINEDNINILEHLIVCLVGEVGEFANILKKIRRGDFLFDDKEQDLNEELTDIFIYLIKISNLLNTDLDTNFLEKLNKNKIRFKKFEK
jgi:NTP pyrophosphatase (non-canonical NTP hydrolase)